MLTFFQISWQSETPRRQLLAIPILVAANLALWFGLAAAITLGIKVAS